MGYIIDTSREQQAQVRKELKKMRNEFTKTQRLAVLLEMGLNLHEEFNKALDKKDVEKALILNDLNDCIDKLMKYIEE